MPKFHIEDIYGIIIPSGHDITRQLLAALAKPTQDCCNLLVNVHGC